MTDCGYENPEMMVSLVTKTGIKYWVRVFVMGFQTVRVGARCSKYDFWNHDKFLDRNRLRKVFSKNKSTVFF